MAANSNEREDLLAIAAAVGDGAAIDWDEAERTAPDEEARKRVRRLRLVSDIALVHDTLSGAGDGEEPGAAAGTPPLDRWGSLELLEKIGEGAFSEVYRARDPRLDAEVALKLLKPRGRTEESAVFAPIREGRLLARVRHANVVAVYGADWHRGRVGLWMELLHGRDLEQILAKDGPFGAHEAALVGIDLCGALAAVHAAGLVHQDVKARNVMRAAGGRIVLMDLGAGLEARDLEDDAAERPLAGTPLYVAPEIFDGESPSPRSDIYSLGVLLHHLVTGAYPVRAATLGEMAQAHARGLRRRLRDERPDLPGAFIEVVERALAPSPAERFQTAGEFESALRAALADRAEGFAPAPPRRTRRPAWIAAAAAASAALVAFGAYLALRSPTTPAASGAPAAAAPAAAAPPPAPKAAPSASSAAAPAATGALPSVKELLGAAAADFTAEATFFRTDASGARQALLPGAQLSLGDLITMEFKASAPVHLYVVDIDAAGDSFLLFPLAGAVLGNPLPAGPHVLPGPVRGPDGTPGEPVAWKVTSAGGTERMLIVASRERWTEFEKETAAMARPREDEPTIALAMTRSAAERFRGLGGLGALPAEGASPAARRSRFAELASRLAGRAASSGGVWVREVDLRNP